jgi:hypothetical protein
MLMEMPSYESTIGIDDDIGPGCDEIDDDEPEGGGDDSDE